MFSRHAFLLAACSATLGCAHASPAAIAAPASSTERLTFVEGRAGRLRVSDGGAGAGPAVVLVHGLGTDLEAWRPQLDHLRAGRRAVAYDQRGHGGSERARDGLDQARPTTERQVLASLDRIDPPAFGLLRKSMLEVVDAPARLAPYRGPAVAVEVGEQPWPGSASARLGLRRVSVGGVSHWLQLDDPAAVNRELDAFLAAKASTP